MARGVKASFVGDCEAFAAHMERVRRDCEQLARLRRDWERFAAALEAARAWRAPTWK